MSEHARHARLNPGSERSFGLVFAAVFAAVAAWPLKSGGEVRLWALAVAALFLAAALLVPDRLRPLNRLWFRLGLWLGAVVTPIVMSLLFFLAVTPTGMLVRALGKDPLRLKLDRAATSYWIRRDTQGPKGSMKNQF